MAGSKPVLESGIGKQESEDGFTRSDPCFRIQLQPFPLVTLFSMKTDMGFAEAGFVINRMTRSAFLRESAEMRKTELDP